jgi:hypothetical protein
MNELLANALFVLWIDRAPRISDLARACNLEKEDVENALVAKAAAELARLTKENERLKARLQPGEKV